jgi:hypothetical protein
MSQLLADNGLAAGGNLSTNPAPAEVRALFEGAGFAVTDQHRVRRPVWTRIVPDLITVGTKS